MVSFRKIFVGVLGLTLLLGLSGCGTFKPEAKSWSLPKRVGQNSGMIIGRLDFPNNKKKNPDGITLNLTAIEFRNKAQGVRSSFNGEETYILNNDYFVVTNLKPGIYDFVSFNTGNIYHSLFTDDGYKTFEVKPGQIKFVGSQDYIQFERSFLQTIGKIHPYKLRPSDHPTELEMLQWLNSVSKGSGWEAAIKKRILELGGQS